MNADIKDLWTPPNPVVKAVSVIDNALKGNNLADKMLIKEMLIEWCDLALKTTPAPFVVPEPEKKKKKVR